ncbi:MAG: response regulator transcription factor [Campylobacterota bacterium]|nr:response regulator transcription factor [Campylobacterota bacterium]
MLNSKELYKYTKELNILFVEDHNELRISTAEMLNNFFKNVTAVENGQIALEIYKQNYKDSSKNFDIVLSDIQMPLLNGVELTQEIYNIDSKQTIIIVSAYDESQYLLPLINLGIEFFIKKPIDFQELLKVLLNSSKRLSLNSKPNSNLNIIQLDEISFFNKENSSCYVNNTNIYLTKYEIIFLQLLSNQLDKIYSNQKVVDYFRSLDENIDPQNIRKLVSKLRKKLPENSIESIYGVGYKILLFTQESSNDI